MNQAAAASAQSTDAYIALNNRYGANNYSPLDVVLCRGEGAFVWDVDGNRYTDMLSAYSALNQGHCHPRLVRTMQEQCAQLTLTSRAFHNDKLPAMLEKIATLSGFERVLPMNTGAEAVETAIKCMRRWGYMRKGVAANQAEIIVVDDNFHGRTTTIVGFSSDPDARDGFGPAMPGFKRVPFGNTAALEAAITPNTVGVLIEPIQGEAGVKLPPDGYLASVRDLCTRHNVIYCLDEIQTGLGRTGRMFCFEHSGVRPDMIVLGKALSGGFYPVSCMCTSEAIMSVFTPGSHGSTFGGSPLAAALSVEALDILIDEKLPERAARLGAHMLHRLRGGLTNADIVDIRGLGLLLAVEYRTPVAKAYCKQLKKRGLLAKDTHHTTIRFAPPLVIHDADMDAAIDLILDVLNQPLG